MRIWHKELIPLLPREQLVAQWRECSAIAGNIIKKGTPNHILVNKILKFPINHFISYSYYIREEMLKRNYHPRDFVWNKILSLDNTIEKDNFIPIKKDILFDKWHTPRYFIQCYYNLEEKHDCGGISDNDFLKIYSYYIHKIYKY